uniref:Shootin 2 n=1 Tax=Tetraodon nigroviridis TaxID=99883 RepID=H3CD08_TETNG
RTWTAACGRRTRRRWTLVKYISQSDGDGQFSSEEEGDVQSAILEMQRDEANQRVRKLEEASSQLLREIDMLEIQFQIERSCRESAEALAVKMSRENSVLKRASQALMPLIPEQLEDAAALTSDPEVDSATVGGDAVDGSKERGDDTQLLLESQAKIAELQTIVDDLLTDKLLLEQQIEDLTKEGLQLREQLELQVEEKEAIMREMNKQSRTMNKIKRVSQLVTQEFTEMSEELELQRGLRQHAEDFCFHLMQKATREQGSDVGVGVGVDLRRAMEQVSIISEALFNIQHWYQEKPRQSGTEESGVLSEVQRLKDQLEMSEEQRKDLERQLSEASLAAAQLQGEGTARRPGHYFCSILSNNVDVLYRSTSRSPTVNHYCHQVCPPPPPTLPSPTFKLVSVSVLSDLFDLSVPPSPVVLRRKTRPVSVEPKRPDIRANAVEEMMARIKKGIVLRPVSRKQEDDGTWTDQRNENRKSAIVELKGMLDQVKHQPLRGVAPRKRMSRNVEEAELLRVLQRRRRVMEDGREPNTSTQTQESEPAAESCAWAGESGSAPVLRRLRQNREKRSSRLRASALIIGQAD